MNWGGPEFVLAIIAMAMLAGVMKTSIRARHGLPFEGRGRRGRRAEIEQMRGESSELVERMREENRRLSGRLEIVEDRLIVLEKIVTDRGYDLANQIEALRDQERLADRLGDRRKERND